MPNEKAITKSREIIMSLARPSLEEPWTARRDRLMAQLSSDGIYQTKNDLAVALMHTGDPQQAIKLLNEIEAEHPGAFQTAANLGTAYELSGNPSKALEWIKEGIRRNPEDHEGSEWIHVRILEAKLAIAKDPSWLNDNSVLGPEFEMASKYPFETLPVGNEGKVLSVAKIDEHLRYQLHERLQFTKGLDPIVGHLLADLGDIVRSGAPGFAAARGLYQMAVTYGDDRDSTQANLQMATRLQTLHRTSDSSVILIGLTIAGLFLAVTALIAYRALRCLFAFMRSRFAPRTTCEVLDSTSRKPQASLRRKRTQVLQEVQSERESP